MTKVIDGQGLTKTIPAVHRGLIIGFYGTAVPNGWGLCDGTNGTPDLRDRFILGDTVVGTGSAAGTASPVTGLVHTGFALTNHSAHSPTQPGAHSAHGVTQPDAHSAHVATQPDTHATHNFLGAHSHDAHTSAATGSIATAGVKLIGPVAAHSVAGSHQHDAHPAHTGFGVDAHSAHSGFAVDAHSAHSAFAVDAHSAHSVTQPDTHTFLHIQLAYIMKL